MISITISGDEERQLQELSKAIDLQPRKVVNALVRMAHERKLWQHKDIWEATPPPDPKDEVKDGSKVEDSASVGPDPAGLEPPNEGSIWDKEPAPMGDPGPPDDGTTGTPHTSAKEAGPPAEPTT